MANNESRFQFPGFRLTAIQDTRTHEVEVGQIEDGDAVFVLHLIRNAMHTKLSFLVSKITDTRGELLWNFKGEQFDGAGLLAKADDDIVVALVGRGKTGKVERIIPLSQLVDNKPIDMRQMMHLKLLAAEFLGREHILSQTEKTLMGADQKRKAAEAEEAERLAEEARKDARIERLKRILVRGKVTGFTSDGRLLRGIPVLETEWPSLSHGVCVIIVESVDEKTGKVGPIVEAFKVIKERGKNPQKGFAAAVTATKPVVTATAATRAEVPRPVRTIVAEKDGKAFEVQIYPSMEVIRQARAAGLNGGTLVAVDQKSAGGRIQVFALRDNRIDTMGNFTPIA